jgi:hypothetical protein
MLFAIFSWVVSESMTLGVIAFTILTLSRINRKERAGWIFIKPTLLKTVLLTAFSMCFYSVLIFVFDMPIYYRFYNKSVVIFYFFWKFLGFILVFDRLYTKIWLEWKLRFQSLHSHGIEWSTHLSKLKRKIIKRFGEKVHLVKNKSKNP